MGLDHEVLTPEQQERLGQALRNRMHAALLTALLLVIILVITTFVVSHSDLRRHLDPWVLWPLTVGVPLLVLAAGTAASSRRLRQPGPQRRLMLSGEPGDIRRVWRDLFKGRVVSPEDREIAASLVGTMRARSRIGWGWLAFGVCWIILALVEHDRQGPVLAIGMLAIGLLYLVLGGGHWWSARRAVRHAATQGIDAGIGGSPPPSNDQ